MFRRALTKATQKEIKPSLKRPPGRNNDATPNRFIRSTRAITQPTLIVHGTPVSISSSLNTRMWA